MALSVSILTGFDCISLNYKSLSKAINYFMMYSFFFSSVDFAPKKALSSFFCNNSHL